MNRQTVVGPDGSDRYQRIRAAAHTLIGLALLAAPVVVLSPLAGAILSTALIGFGGSLRACKTRFELAATIATGLLAIGVVVGGASVAVATFWPTHPTSPTEILAPVVQALSI